MDFTTVCPRCLCIYPHVHLPPPPPLRLKPLILSKHPIIVQTTC